MASSSSSSNDDHDGDDDVDSNSASSSSSNNTATTTTHTISPPAAAAASTPLPLPPLHVLSSAELSQVVLLPEDQDIDRTLFPRDLVDVNSQQIDLRKKNSWLLRMHEVSTPGKANR